jgi:hypothetical protein
VEDLVPRGVSARFCDFDSGVGHDVELDEGAGLRRSASRIFKDIENAVRLTELEMDNREELKELGIELTLLSRVLNEESKLKYAG